MQLYMFCLLPGTPTVSRLPSRLRSPPFSQTLLPRKMARVLTNQSHSCLWFDHLIFYLERTCAVRWVYHVYTVTTRLTQPFQHHVPSLDSRGSNQFLRVQRPFTFDFSSYPSPIIHPNIRTVRMIIYRTVRTITY